MSGQFPTQAPGSVASRDGNLVNQITGAVTLRPDQKTNQVAGNATTGNYTITLPSAEEAAGGIYTFYATIADAAVVTLADNGTSFDWTGNYTLDTDGDAIALYSDGRKWWPFDTQIT